MISQQVAGHRVDVLENEGDWVRARGADGYEGWMHVGFLARAPHASARQSRQPSRVSLGCVTHDRARRSPLASAARASRAGRSRRSRRGGRGDSTRASAFRSSAHAITQQRARVLLRDELPVGRRDAVGRGLLGARAERVRAARRCSCRATHGSRRSWVTDAGRDIGELSPADLLFFSDRADKRITHVGIALGERRMVHLALGRGGYAVEQLDDRNDAVRRSTCASDSSFATAQCSGCVASQRRASAQHPVPAANARAARPHLDADVERVIRRRSRSPSCTRPAASIGRSSCAMSGRSISATPGGGAPTFEIARAVPELVPARAQPAKASRCAARRRRPCP